MDKGQRMRDWVGMAGFSLVVAGAVGYDWRAGLVIAGALMLIAALIGMWLSRPKTRKK